VKFVRGLVEQSATVSSAADNLVVFHSSLPVRNLYDRRLLSAQSVG